MNHHWVSWATPQKKAATWVESHGMRSGPLDAYGRHQQPTSLELIQQLKNVAFTCATLNASACAAHPPQLYVTTGKSQAEPKCHTKTLAPQRIQELRDLWKLATVKAERIEEVVNHPLLDLLEQVNPVHNAWDLWELTTLYQEVDGNTYWHLTFDKLDRPDGIWILPSQYVRPVKTTKKNSYAPD